MDRTILKYVARFAGRFWAAIPADGGTTIHVPSAMNHTNPAVESIRHRRHKGDSPGSAGGPVALNVRTQRQDHHAQQVSNIERSCPFRTRKAVLEQKAGLIAGRGNVRNEVDVSPGREQ